MKMEKIKKVSPLYLIAYILLPVAVAWVVLLIAVLTLNDVAGPIVCIAVFAAAIGWWVCGSGFLQKRQLKKLERPRPGGAPVYMESLQAFCIPCQTDWPRMGGRRTERAGVYGSQLSGQFFL